MSLILLALQLEQVISDRAKGNLVTSTGGANPRPLAISPNPVTPINTRAEIAKNSGVSSPRGRSRTHLTVEHHKEIDPRGASRLMMSFDKHSSSKHQP